MPVAEGSPPKTWRNVVANTLIAAGGFGTLAWIGYLAWVAEETVRAVFS